jgi:hypothetical protein
MVAKLPLAATNTAVVISSLHDHDRGQAEGVRAVAGAIVAVKLGHFSRLDCDAASSVALAFPRCSAPPNPFKRWSQWAAIGFNREASIRDRNGGLNPVLFASSSSVSGWRLISERSAFPRSLSGLFEANVRRGPYGLVRNLEAC